MGVTTVATANPGIPFFSIAGVADPEHHSQLLTYVLETQTQVLIPTEPYLQPQQ